MKKFVLSMVAGILALSNAQPQDTAAPAERVQAVQEVTATRESLALTYPEGATISVKFSGTQRLPRASGEAKVQRKKGMTEIEIEVDEMKPAALFGGDFNTYVLWTVSPEGYVDNVGKFVMQGNRSKLNVSTRLETFGMFVTAEPHFLVSSPSRFVVLENTRPTRNISDSLVGTSQIRYRGFDGVYRFDRETLSAATEVTGETRTDIREAQTAIDLAVRAGAEKHASEELARAREALKKALDAAVGGADRRNLMLLGHEVVRLAYDAQKLAEERSFQAALDAERKSHADEAARLSQAVQSAQTEAERARLEAEQRALQLRIEEDARRVAAARAAEEERLRREAEARASQAQQEAQQLARAKSEAELAAERAQQELERERREREAARARLQEALGRVAETRETARGLIVNLPDILFDFNKWDLRPQGREVLSKIAGILLVAHGYRLKLEGHTDSIGSDSYNQTLSERRAESVRNYLVQSGVSADIVTTQGFGKSQPIASNGTAEGRQKNRRVEIVIEETESFGTGGTGSR